MIMTTRFRGNVVVTSQRIVRGFRGNARGNDTILRVFK